MHILICLFLGWMTALTGSTTGLRGNFEMGAGYRSDQLKWSIGNGAEARWRDMHSALVVAKGHMTACDHIYLRGLADWGSIMCGESRITRGDVSRINGDANGNHVFDLDGGIGYNVLALNCPWQLVPMVGYSLHGQNLRVTDGVETITFPGGLQGFHVGYESRWKGPWMGGEIAFRPCGGFRFAVSGEYHFACFEGKGKWRVNDSFGNRFENKFRQHTWGRGVLIDGNVTYASCCCPAWGFGVHVTYQQFWTRPGTHRTVRSIDTLIEDIGILPITTSATLNRVDWRAFGISIVLDCNF